MAKRRIFIQKDNIDQISSCNQQKIGTVRTVYNEGIKLFGLTLLKPSTKYTCYTSTNDYTHSTKHEAIQSMWPRLEDETYYIIDNDNVVFEKPHVKITLTNTYSTYYVYFENEKEMDKYLDELQLDASLFGLKYDSQS